MLSRTSPKLKENLQNYSRYEFLSIDSACRLNLQLNYDDSEIFEYFTIIERGQKVNLFLKNINNFNSKNSKFRLLKLENNYRENSKIKFDNIEPNNNQRILC